jgi:hypothetical protein
VKLEWHLELTTTLNALAGVVALINEYSKARAQVALIRVLVDSPPSAFA